MSYLLGGLGRHVPAVLKPEPVFGSLGDPVPDPPPFQPPPQAYVRGSLPRTYRNKRWTPARASFGPSPIFSQYAPVRGLLRKVAKPAWQHYPACAPGVYCVPPAYGGFGVDAVLSPEYSFKSVIVIAALSLAAGAVGGYVFGTKVERGEE